MKRLIVPALFAGLVGGLAEMAWIGFYSSATSTSGMEIARLVTVTVFASAADAPWASWAGVGVHIALSLSLGLVFVLSLWGLSSARPSTIRIWVTAVIALVAVWAVNFLLVLPALDSGFATLMPYGATLLSKTLFGAAMASVLQQAAVWSSSTRRDLAVCA